MRYAKQLELWAARRRRIVQLYLPEADGGQGWPVQKIANRYMMSRQRIEQIIAIEAKKNTDNHSVQDVGPEKNGNENQITTDSTVRVL